MYRIVVIVPRGMRYLFLVQFGYVIQWDTSHEFFRCNLPKDSMKCRVLFRFYHTPGCATVIKDLVITNVLAWFYVFTVGYLAQRKMIWLDWYCQAQWFSNHLQIIQKDLGSNHLSMAGCSIFHIGRGALRTCRKIEKWLLHWVSTSWIITSWFPLDHHPTNICHWEPHMWKTQCHNASPTLLPKFQHWKKTQRRRMWSLKKSILMWCFLGCSDESLYRNEVFSLNHNRQHGIANTHDANHGNQWEA